MSRTEETKKDSSNGNGAKKAEAALESVSSGIVALRIQKALDEGKKIYIPSLDITLGKNDTKDTK